MFLMRLAPLLGQAADVPAEPESPNLAIVIVAATVLVLILIYDFFSRSGTSATSA